MERFREPSHLVGVGLVVLFITACYSRRSESTDDPDDVGPASVAEGCGLVGSGSRLKARRLVGEDGSWLDLSRFGMFFDSLRHSSASSTASSVSAAFRTRRRMDRAGACRALRR